MRGKNENHRAIKVMICEDEVLSALALKRALENRGYEVSDLVTKGEAAIQNALAKNPDVILMDIFLANHIDGIEAAQRIQEKQAIPVLYISAYSDDQTVSKSKQTQSLGFVSKPYEFREVITKLEAYFRPGMA